MLCISFLIVIFLPYFWDKNACYHQVLLPHCFILCSIYSIFCNIFFKIEFCLTENQPTDETLPDHFCDFHENWYNF
jgi:hypothetical protein